MKPHKKVTKKEKHDMSDCSLRTDLQAEIQNDEILREDLNDSYAEEIKEELREQKDIPSEFQKILDEDWEDLLS